MFGGRSPHSAQLAGLLVGRRRLDVDRWEVAIPFVRVEAIVVHGISLPIGPWQDLIAPSDVGWPVFGRVRLDDTIAVFIRNDAPELRELRAVLVVHGGDGRDRGPRDRLLAG